MKPSDPVVPENDGLEGMTVEVRRDEAGGCVVDIGGDAALLALEQHARSTGMTVEELVFRTVRAQLRLRRTPVRV